MKGTRHHKTGVPSLTFHNAALGGNQMRYTTKTRGSRSHSLFNTVIEYFVLFRAHRKNSVERESILLWPRNGLRVLHLHGLEILIEGDYDIAALSEFESIWGPKPIQSRQ
jgi:hypothetical protein